MKDQVTEFLKAPFDDNEFRQKLDSVADIVKLAESKGFSFTESEFNDEIKDITSKIDPDVIARLMEAYEKLESEDEELSAEELESVSGGITPVLTMALPFGYGTAIVGSCVFWGVVLK